MNAPKLTDPCPLCGRQPVMEFRHFPKRIMHRYVCLCGGGESEPFQLADDMEDAWNLYAERTVNEIEKGFHNKKAPSDKLEADNNGQTNYGQATKLIR